MRAHCMHLTSHNYAKLQVWERAWACESIKSTYHIKGPLEGLKKREQGGMLPEWSSSPNLQQWINAFMYPVVLTQLQPTLRGYLGKQLKERGCQWVTYRAGTAYCHTAWGGMWEHFTCAIPAPHNYILAQDNYDICYPVAQGNPASACTSYFLEQKQQHKFQHTNCTILWIMSSESIPDWIHRVFKTIALSIFLQESLQKLLKHEHMNFRALLVWMRHIHEWINSEKHGLC